MIYEWKHFILQLIKETCRLNEKAIKNCLHYYGIKAFFHEIILWTCYKRILCFGCVYINTPMCREADEKLQKIND